MLGPKFLLSSLLRFKLHQYFSLDHPEQDSKENNAKNLVDKAGQNDMEDPAKRSVVVEEFITFLLTVFTDRIGCSIASKDQVLE